MFYDIPAGNKMHLSEIARSLKENITLRITVDRLKKLNAVQDTELILRNYLGSVKQQENTTAAQSREMTFCFRYSIIKRNTQKGGLFMHQQDSIDLSGSWQFAIGTAEEAVFSDETILLPGTMDLGRKGADHSAVFSPRYLHRDYVYMGSAAYRRSIAVPPEWEGRSLFLYLERTKKSRVWVDGQSVGPRQKSYTTPHRYDLTAFCRPGQTHILTIEVDNSSAGMPHAMYSTLWEGEAWSHQLTEHSQTNWNGIIGALRLDAFPALSVSLLRLRPDLANRSVQADVTLTRSCTGKELHGCVILQAESWNSDQPVHQTEPQTAEFSFAPEESDITLSLNHNMGETCLLWDEFHPNLYRMRVTLRTTHSGTLQCTDATADFGMRSFTAGEHQGGRQFFINGRPTILRGEINCAVFPDKGHCPMHLSDWLRIFKIYKSYGLNHVRFHTWVPPMAAFQAADRSGLYLYVELPHWGRRMFGDVAQGDYTDVQYYEGEVKRIFTEYLNSPSFVMFALGNEERIGFYYYEEFLKFCNALEPGLLYSDIAGHSTYPAHADFASKWLDPGYLPLVNARSDWDYAEAVRNAPVPITGHEVGQLQVYPDYDKELPAFAGCILRPRNLEHFRDILAQAGLADRAADFHRATGRLAAMLYRCFTESYLRTPGSGGFLLLGLQDFPGQGTALVGLLDSFLESKGLIAPDMFRRSCCELTVLAKMPRFVWKGGETFTAQVVVPNYSEDAAQCKAVWILETEDGELLAKGTLAGRTVPQGQITDFGLIEAKLPLLPCACHVLLKLSLDSLSPASCAPGINDYSLWLFPPEQSTTVPENVVLCRSFHAQAEAALERGQNVLIISEGTSSALPNSRAVSFRPDFWSPMFHTNDPDGYSLGIFVEQEHPLFRSFPTDCFGDWQWFEPLQNARGILINRMPLGLRPIVQPIASIDLPDRLAMLFEAKVGTGRLFVSTIDLLQRQDIASRQLLSAIYRYVSSDAFQPETTLEPALLRSCLPPLDLTAIRLRGKSTLNTGETFSYLVDCFDSHGVCERPSGKQIQFYSDTPDVLQVNEDGLAQAVGEGVALLSAACFDSTFRFTDSMAVRINQRMAAPLPLNGALISASSSHPQHPAANMLTDDRSAFWQSDYLDRTRRLPQWIEIRLQEETMVCALLCGAWRESSRGAILRARLSGSLDGIQFDEICCREWDESTIPEDRLFAFPPRPVRYLRLNVDWAVMHTGDSNAVSITHLALYNSKLIASVEPRPACPVRFGTPLQKALFLADLPSRLPVLLADNTTQEADVVWLADSYSPDIPGDYLVRGTLFASGIANPGEVCARQILRVLPKDMTTPPDKSRMDCLLHKLKKLGGLVTDAASRSRLDEFLTQAESFNALTGAVQHDVDVWTDRIQDALSEIE